MIASLVLFFMLIIPPALVIIALAKLAELVGLLEDE